MLLNTFDLMIGVIYIRVTYNWNSLFKDIPKNKRQTYHQRIYQFIEDVSKVNMINDQIIQKYTLKKMNGTKGIFKFYADNDGTRCLIKYEESDDLIFNKEPGIVILKVTSHDRQGEVARRIDQQLVEFDDFLEGNDDIIGHESELEAVLSKSYMKSIFISDNMSMDQIAEIISDDDAKTVYPPSITQKRALQGQLPLLLLGCAGSGKTLIEVCKSLKLAHSNVTQAYFTYTNGLKEMSEAIYQKYKDVPGLIGKTSFFAIREYMTDALGLQVRNYMNYERFKQFLKEEKIYQKLKSLEKIQAVELWIEIRGVIKGYLGKAYYRNLMIKNIKNAENPELIQKLIEQNIIEFNPKSRLYYVKEGEKLKNVAEQHPKLRIVLFENDFHQPTIDHYSYIELNEDYSRFSKEERKTILEFVEKYYQPYLTKKNLFDDNDLARRLVIESHRSKITKFDTIFIDEVQDLSEMQIYALMQLSHKPGHIFMAGDVSQIINPTLFKGGRPGLLLRNRLDVHWSKNNVHVLNENYRNSRDIVEVANKLVSIRKERLGSYSEYIIEDAIKVEKSDGLPAILNINQSEIIEAIKIWIDVPKVAIVVSGDSAKKNLFISLGIDRNKQGSNIYTVQEIKGREFDKVILYNIISDYDDLWTEIMTTTVKNRQEHYQFYFNLFYVALTRARKNLYVYEDNPQNAVIQALSPLFETVTNNAVGILDISEYQSNEEMLEQAIKHFANEEYDRAKIYYLHLNRKKDVIICLGHELIQRGSFKEGIEILYRFEEYYDTIFKYTDPKETTLFRFLLGFKTKKLSIESISQMLGNQSVMDLVKHLKKDKNYLSVYSDTIDLMQKVKQYRVYKELGENHGRIS
ncbi:UvrD-helicase domain-containing protein [Methanobacterium sp. YSL]|nr:UvrD-helicase domain-containing protein [Methanobacterium sp. YSL]